VSSAFNRSASSMFPERSACFNRVRKPSARSFASSDSRTPTYNLA
jgi:hypothetical protein